MRSPGDDPRRSADGRERLGRRPNFLLPATVAIGAFLCLTLNPASAATQVSGRQDHLQVKVQRSSIKQVFDALSAKFHLTYKLPQNIGMHSDLTGVYSGTISQVLSRILDGHDYVIESSKQGYKVIVFRRSGAIAYNSAAQPETVGEGPPAPSNTSKPVTGRPPVLPSSNPSPPPLSSYVAASKSATTGQAVDH